MKYNQILINLLPAFVVLKSIECTNNQLANSTSDIIIPEQKLQGQQQDPTRLQPYGLSGKPNEEKCNNNIDSGGNRCDPNAKSTEKLLSRRKRYVAFPEGSSFSVRFRIDL